MDKAKMAAMGKTMNRLQENWDSKADQYASLVRIGTLTASKAAQALAGADMKEREAIAEDTGFAPGPGGGIEAARQAIDSRLPGYAGLVPGLHV